MPVSRLDADELLAVLQELGARMQWSTEVEIVIIGGAAGILTGVLERRLTSDCDVPMHVPKEAWPELRRHAIDIAQDRGLSRDWLNTEVRGLSQRLPTDWRDRATRIGRFGVLTVTAIGRRDLIAMKFIAGRAEDRADLKTLAIDRDDAAFVRNFLDELERAHPRERPQVADALELLEHGGLVTDERP